MKINKYSYKHDTWHLLPHLQMYIEPMQDCIMIGFGINVLNMSFVAEFKIPKKNG
jgi:hypothetical protein